MTMAVRTLSVWAAAGEKPEILYWVGCAASFDDRAQKIARAFAKLLDAAGVKWGILGTEEACTGDPAKRAGNDFLFQMLALQNIQVLQTYEVKEIVATCPHCFNTLKNEYPQLGGTFKVWHHTQYLSHLIQSGRLKLPDNGSWEEKVVFHDPCYLGRGNGEYDAPRFLLKKTGAQLEEPERHKDFALCCGAGGAQMFKEPEPGHKDINIERTEELLRLSPKRIAVGCPFCMTMLTDGVKHAGKQTEVRVQDVAEILAERLGLL
ncbi:MAG: (Fe-S)-binding protein [Bacteroidia bacterium]|nr:(Fe-S)-binding protein [Bacteroidia bacterium]MCX7651436.1 (Fe-S)-binding protein [Bacteroidia bacterium]MDW8417071.1 (Fe-S)-binding protein [Bacteroidia bacterium]